MTLTRPELVEHALEIARDYRSQGLTLTLRQMYYQFVARGLVPNGQKVYKRIGATLTDARYNGDFPPAWLEDRGRSVSAGDYTRNDDQVPRALRQASQALGHLPHWYLGRARWYGQRTHVSVWVEKEALSGVFAPVCGELGVSWFAWAVARVRACLAHAASPGGHHGIAWAVRVAPPDQPEDRSRSG